MEPEHSAETAMPAVVVCSSAEVKVSSEIRETEAVAPEVLVTESSKSEEAVPEEFAHWIIRQASESAQARDVTRGCTSSFDDCALLWHEDPEAFILRFSPCMSDDQLGVIASGIAGGAAQKHASRVLILRQRAAPHKMAQPAQQAFRPRSVRDRNRRYIRAQILLAEGSYFSDESVKERHAELYFNHLGCLLDDSRPGNGYGGGGELQLGDALVEASRALSLTQVAKSPFQPPPPCSPFQPGSRAARAVEDGRASMIRAAVEKFMEGFDSEWVNYPDDIDGNAALDDSRENDREAEDAYFDEDDDEDDGGGGDEFNDDDHGADGAAVEVDGQGGMNSASDDDSASECGVKVSVVDMEGGMPEF